MADEPIKLITTACTACKANYQVPDTIAGKTIACKKCGQKFIIQALPPPYPLVAKLAVDNQLLTVKQVAEAMALQVALKKAGREMPLEEIFLKKQMLRQEDLFRLLIAANRKLDKEFGAILVKENLGVQADIDAALKEQSDRFTNSGDCFLIGDLLVASGKLTREKQEALLAQQQRKDALKLLRLYSPKHGQSGAAAPQPEEPAAAVPDAEAQKVVASKQEVFTDKKFFRIRNLDKAFVHYALGRKLITQEEADQALSEQLKLYEESKRRMLVGDILVALGVIQPQQRDRMLVEQKRSEEADLTFGEMCIKMGAVSQERLDLAFSLQTKQLREKRLKASVAGILIQIGDLTEEQAEVVKQKVLEELAAAAQKDSGEMTHAGRFQLQDCEFEFEVSSDSLKAVIHSKAEDLGTVSAEHIRNYLAGKQIIHGIANDQDIENFLKQKPDKRRPFEIAVGRPARPGREGGIKYFFETEPLKVGSIQEDGYIDYKDRGEIPHVAQGDLIAELIPMIQGEPGVTIYGETIPVPHIKEAKIRVGAGVELSEDGTRAFAKIGGRPELSFGGKLSVLAEMKIKGDVCWETGHIDFPGNIEVGGTIQTGFRVKAVQITAKEILGAEIEASGDILISGGISGAVIKTQGGVTAKYIQNSRIAAFGDVVTQKEIIDSTIDTSGACIVKGGKVIASVISAKMGVEALDIGSEISSPNKLKVGVDQQLDQKLAEMKQAINELEARKLAVTEEVGKLDAEEQSLQVQIARSAQDQDRSEVEIRSLKKKQADPAEDQAQLSARINELHQKAKTAEKMINELFEQQDRFEQKKLDFQSRLREVEEKIAERNAEREGIMRWAQQQQGNPVVRARGAIFSGTAIFGPHVSMILRESYKRAQLKESRVLDPKSDVEWELKLSMIKA